MRKFMLFAALILSSVSLWAEPVGQTEALNTARAFLAAKGKALLQTSQPVRAPRKSAQAQASDASYYVFNVGGEQGYVIVSGDDRTEQVLGYVDNGHFDAENLPINMQGMLQYYSDAIKHLDDNNIQLPSRKNQPRRVQATRRSVPILMASRWNQGFPYNKHCPIYYNGDGTTGQSVTGCTATAIAQVINYYKSPEKTKNIIPSHSNTYTLNNGSTKTVTLKAIPRGTVIDWANMCDVYDGDETEAQQDAVGKLMLYVGMCVKMGYGASSGAVHGSNVPELLNKYFGFDDGAYCASRYDYSADEWEELLYSELSTGHPLSYQGFSSGGGHAFVVDGYDGEGLYHLNWGWGGSSDGWFVISILNPGDNSGIGASNSTDGYNMSNNAIIGVRPVDDGIKSESATCATMNSVSINGTSIKLNFINWTGAAGTFNCGIVEAQEDGSVKLVSTSYNMTVDPNYYHSPSFEMKGRLTEGVHRLSPANKLSTNKTYRPLYDLKRNYIEATVTNGSLTMRLVEPQPRLEVSKIEFPGTRVAGKEQEVRFTVKNMGDEALQHMYMLAGKSTSPASATSKTESCVLVRSQDSTVVSYYFMPTSTGTYNIWLASDQNGSEIYGHATMEAITEAEASKPKLSVSSMSITNVVSGVVYGNFLEGKISIKNNGNKPFAGRIKLQSWSQNPGEGSAWSSKSTSVYVEAEPLKIATATFELTEMRTDCKYWISVNDVATGTQLTNGGVWNHGWDMHPGLVGWKTDGTKAVASTSTTTIASTWCGVSIAGVTTSRHRPNKTSNTIYAFSDGITPYSTMEGHNVVLGNRADSIHLVSDTAYCVPVEFTAAKATFRYDFTEAIADKWSVVTLPFTPDAMLLNGELPMELNGDNTPFVIYEFAEEGEDGMPVFKPATELHANSPYLITTYSSYVGQNVTFVAENTKFVREGDDKKVVAGKSFRFYGSSMAPKVENAYILNSAGTAFEYVTTATAIRPISGYFTTTLDEGTRPAIIPVEEAPIPTGIERVPVSIARPAANDVYTLEGRKVPAGTPLTRGIYVIGGRKTLVH